MKVILEIEDELLSNMQRHAEIVQEDLNVMLSNMFIKMVVEPGEIISNEVRKDDCSEFEAFQSMLFKWCSNISYTPNDISLHNVLLRLRDEHPQHTHIIADL